MSSSPAINLSRKQVLAFIAMVSLGFAVMVVSLMFMRAGGFNRLHEGNVPDVVAETLSVAVSGSTTSFPDVKIKQQLSFVNERNVLCKHYFYQTQAQNMQAIACFENGKWVNEVAEAIESETFGVVDEKSQNSPLVLNTASASKGEAVARVPSAINRANGENAPELNLAKTSKVAQLMESTFLSMPLSQQQEREMLHNLHSP